MKKIFTYLNVITCFSLVACGDEHPSQGKNSPGVGDPKKVPIPSKQPENGNKDQEPGPRQKTPTNTSIPPQVSDVEQLRKNVEKFVTVDINNCKEFQDIVSRSGFNGRPEVAVTKHEIKDNIFTGEILGKQISINFANTDDFEKNVDLYTWLVCWNKSLPSYPLNSKTFPQPEGKNFFDNLDKLYWCNNTQKQQFSVENGIVKLNGEEFFKLDSIDKFCAFADGLMAWGSRCSFFDDSVFKNPITWLPGGQVQFYGGEKCNAFSNENSFKQLLKGLSKIKNCDIRIKNLAPITLTQTDNDKIQLGGQDLDKSVWQNAWFWDTVSDRYYLLFDKTSTIEVEKNGNALNEVKIGGTVITDFKKNVFSKEDGKFEFPYVQFFKEKND